MSNLRSSESEQNTRLQDGLAGELPVQPSSLASASMQLPLASETAIAEPIPSTEVPAASPLPDRRRNSRPGSVAKWWPVALFLAVLATIGALAASKSGDQRVGPADRTSPGSPVAPR